MYKYFKNNEEVSRKDFINALGEALPQHQRVSDFISIAIADYDRAEKEVRKMIYSIKTNGRRNKSTTLVTSNGVFYIERKGE